MTPSMDRASVVVSTQLDAGPAAKALRAAAREYRVLAERHEEAALRLEAIGVLIEPGPGKEVGSDPPSQD